MIYLISSVVLGIVFFFFRARGNFDILISFEFLFLIPFVLYLASHALKIIRLREAQEEDNKHLPSVIGVHLFSEALSNMFLFFLRDIYAFIFSFFTVKKKSSFFTRLLVLRSIDVSFYLLSSFLILSIKEPFINMVRFDLFIYLIALSILLVFLKRNIDGIELNRMFFLSGMIWALEIIAFFSFLFITYKGRSVTWVDALTSFFTNFSILTDPYVKWFSLVLMMVTIPILFILGKKELSQEKDL